MGEGCIGRRGQAQGLPLRGVWLVGAFEGDAGLGTHKGCPYGDLVGLAVRGLAEFLRLGTCPISTPGRRGML